MDLWKRWSIGAITSCLLHIGRTWVTLIALRLIEVEEVNHSRLRLRDRIDVLGTTLRLLLGLISGGLLMLLG